MKGMELEVILALVLVDLPLDLETNTMREMFGDSWWYLTCDCNDVFCDVVTHIASEICTVEQVRLLSFWQDRGIILFRRASPKCRRALANAMRICGRFEVTEDIGGGIYHAVDYGNYAEGQRVVLHSFPNQGELHRAVSEFPALSSVKLPSLTCCCQLNVIEKITSDAGSENYFPTVTSVEMSEDDVRRSRPMTHLLAVDKPSMTLADIVYGMTNSEKCQEDTETRQRYNLKVWAIFRSVAKGLRRLHSAGLVHGHLRPEVCGKHGEDERWKLGGILSLQLVGELAVAEDRPLPPEAVEPVAQHGNSSGEQAVLRNDFAVTSSTDVWAFGKLCYEVLIGQPLVGELATLLHWSEFDIQDVLHELEQVGVSTSGKNLISACLSVDPSTRPSMEEIVQDPLWAELRQISGERKSHSTLGRKSLASTAASQENSPRMLV